MRLHGWLGLAVLVTGAMACSDALGPPPLEGRDLDFFVPSSDRPAVRSGYRAWNDSVGPGDSLTIQRMAGGPLAESAQQVPLISQVFVAGEWNGPLYSLQYGMFGGGTGYTMTPTVRILNGQGVTVLSGQGLGRTEEIPLYLWMRPTVQESWTVDFECGGFAEAKVLFETRLTLLIFGPTLMRAQANDQATTYQPRCAVPTGLDGGAASMPRGQTITICYYEAWLDAWNNVIAVFEFGCTSVDAGMLAE